MEQHLVRPVVISKHLFRPCNLDDIESMRRILRGIDYEFKSVNPSPSHFFRLGLTIYEMGTVTNITTAISRNPQDRVIVHLMLVLIQEVDNEDSALQELLQFAIMLAPDDNLLFPRIFEKECEKAKSVFYGEDGLGRFWPMLLEDIAQKVSLHFCISRSESLF